MTDNIADVADFEDFSDVEEEMSEVALDEDFHTSPSNEDPKFYDDIFKKWFRTKDKSGFLSVNGWLEAGKLSVDIGEFGKEGLQSSTKAWTDAIKLAAYLQAIRNGLADKLYTKTKDLPTAEGFVHYGGGRIDGKPVSRVLKVHHWEYGSDPKNKQYDSSAFVFKTAHFHARESSSGAFLPDMSKTPLSINRIKVSRVEVVEMSYRVDLALANFAARHDDIFRMLNGNAK